MPLDTPRAPQGLHHISDPVGKVMAHLGRAVAERGVPVSAAARQPTITERVSYRELLKLDRWSFDERRRGQSGIYSAEQQARYGRHDAIVNAAIADGAIFDCAALTAEIELAARAPYPFCKHPERCVNGRCEAEWCCND